MQMKHDNPTRQEAFKSSLRVFLSTASTGKIQFI